MSVEKRANQGAQLGAAAGIVVAPTKYKANKKLLRSPKVDIGRSMASYVRKGVKWGAAGAVAGAGYGLAEKRRSSHEGISSK